MQLFILHGCYQTCLCDLPSTLDEQSFYQLTTWSCTRWGLPCHRISQSNAVSSYLTISPLPFNRAVYFLLHFPSPHGARVLPGILLYGVRTFLTDTQISAQLLGSLFYLQCCHIFFPGFFNFPGRLFIQFFYNKTCMN